MLLRMAFVIVTCFISSLSMALQVEVTGQAVISGAQSVARDKALEDALRQASLRAGVEVNSVQLMNSGVLTQDRLGIRTKGEVRNVEILWENAENGLYQIAIKAEVKALAMCPARNEQNYRKSVAIAGFGMAHPTHASVGQLQNVEQAMPRTLLNTFNRRGGLHALDATGISLYQDPRRAPVSHTAQRRLTSSVALAKNLGAQYVISGVIRDMSMFDAAQYEPSSQNEWLSLVGLEQTPSTRQFVVDIFVHDGLSGALLFQRGYATKGQWNIGSHQNVGFASPRFWRTPYGQKVRSLMSQVVDEVNETLRCQPFMARIVKAKGRRLHIEASAGAGIRPGDKFKVYRTSTFYNLDLEQRTELDDMATVAVVKQVQPQFIVAEMKSSAEHLAIQRNDMVISW